MSEYNGHPSFEHWNVHLWISREELFCCLAKSFSADDLLSALNDLHITHTGDGVRYTEALLQHAIDCMNERYR